MLKMTEKNDDSFHSLVAFFVKAQLFPKLNHAERQLSTSPLLVLAARAAG
jgi:hypothetical protein